MFGKLERDSLGNILCDRCGNKLKWSVVKTSPIAREFINAPFCKRKLIHLCFGCAREFSDLVAKGGWQ